MTLRQKCEALARKFARPDSLVPAADAIELLVLEFGRACADDAYDGCEPPPPSNEALERAIAGTLERCSQ